MSLGCDINKRYVTKAQTADAALLGLQHLLSIATPDIAANKSSTTMILVGVLAQTRCSLSPEHTVVSRMGIPVQRAHMAMPPLLGASKFVQKLVDIVIG